MAKELIKSQIAIFIAVLLANGEFCAAATTTTRCNMTRQGLIACMPSITGKAPSRPSARCCSSLAQADMPCLCAFKNSPILTYLHINPKLAMQLPAKCKLSLPKQCK